MATNPTLHIKVRFGILLPGGIAAAAGSVHEVPAAFAHQAAASNQVDIVPAPEPVPEPVSEPEAEPTPESESAPEPDQPFVDPQAAVPNLSKRSRR